MMGSDQTRMRLSNLDTIDQSYNKERIKNASYYILYYRFWIKISRSYPEFCVSVS